MHRRLVIVIVFASLAMACGGAAPAQDASSPAPATVVAVHTASCRFGDLTRCSAACDEGHMRACNNLGAMYEEGAGVARDRDHALALYTRACAGGARAACTNQSRLSASPSTAATQPPAAVLPPPAAPAPTPPAAAAAAPASTLAAPAATVTTTTTTTTVMSESCTVDGRSVPCAKAGMPGMSITTGPDGEITLSIHGMSVYTEH